MKKRRRNEETRKATQKLEIVFSQVGQQIRVKEEGKRELLAIRNRGNRRKKRKLVREMK